jgi:hypothetical protein
MISPGFDQIMTNPPENATHADPDSSTARLDLRLNAGTDTTRIACAADLLLGHAVNRALGRKPLGVRVLVIDALHRQKHRKRLAGEDKFPEPD